MSQEERIAHNEDWCRDLNERKAEWMKGGLPAAGFRCECWRMDCGARMPLSDGNGRRSARGRTAAVAPGHTAPDVEEVVGEYRHFWIVARGEAGEVAERLG